MKELRIIQGELKAPKNQKNTFGNYMYRSAEDILEAVKPLVHAQNCDLILSDEIIAVADRIYIKSTATIKNENGETESATGYAREPLTKKGMDDSQVTGAASSYARKYALNGLFCIDDNKDADTLSATKQASAQKKADDDELKEAFELIKPNIMTAPSRAYLQDLHTQNVALHKYLPYKKLMNKRFSEVK